jgi:hypothetical protein
MLRPTYGRNNARSDARACFLYNAAMPSPTVLYVVAALSILGLFAWVGLVWKNVQATWEASPEERAKYLVKKAEAPDEDDDEEEDDAPKAKAPKTKKSQEKPKKSAISEKSEPAKPEANDAEPGKPEANDAERPAEESVAAQGESSASSESKPD